MSFQTLRAALVRRLEEGRNGAHGWWLLTRVHLDASRLQSIISYLFDARARDILELTPQHYFGLANVIGIDNPAPWVNINRHYFLALETPLGLLHRANGNRWTHIQLTPAGIRLATEEDPVSVFEEVLQEIKFCKQPWYTASRVREYSDYDVRPYHTTVRLLRRTGGYIDVDEFDLFVSRIRTSDEMQGASESIAEFRTLTESQKALLRGEVEERVTEGSADPRKPYSNWRDMARHTFSLFSLGARAYRSGNELLLSQTLAVEDRRRTPRGVRGPQPRISSGNEPLVRRQRIPTTLRIPESEAPPELLVPPALPQTNTGGEAELLIGKILTAAGWRVLYYSRRRGFGFDLWAQKEDQAFIIEVKSFLGDAGSVTLTSLEHQAATHHGENFLLVVVENTESDAPSIHVIQNPADAIRFNERRTREFTAPRSSWESSASRDFPRKE